MKKCKIILIVLLAIAGCFGARAQDTIKQKDSTFFYGHLNWYDLDTLRQWRSTIDDRYGIGYIYYMDSIDSCYGYYWYYTEVIYPTWLGTSEYADINPPLDNVYNNLRYNHISKYYLGNTIIGNQMVTDRPIKIIGLAACGRKDEAADCLARARRAYAWAVANVPELADDQYRYTHALCLRQTPFERNTMRPCLQSVGTAQGRKQLYHTDVERVWFECRKRW